MVVHHILLGKAQSETSVEIFTMGEQIEDEDDGEDENDFFGER
jgi:hypothetical protein